MQPHQLIAYYRARAADMASKAIALAEEKWPGFERNVLALEQKVAELESAGEERPPVICLCGSTRFREQFEMANKTFTLAGYIVLSVGFFMHAGDGALDADTKAKLGALHKEKIRLADTVYVINADGYVGESTRSEIEYATRIGRSIIFMSPPAPRDAPAESTP